MPNYPEGNIKLISNFELNISKSLDARETVQFFSELDDITYKYDGLISYVSSEKKHYYYNSTTNVWTLIGQGVQIDDNNSSLTTTYSSSKIDSKFTAIGSGSPNELTFMLSNSTSDILNYNDLKELSTFTSSTLGTASLASATLNTELLIKSFSTVVNSPNLVLIPYGLFTINFQSQKTNGAGGNSYLIRAKVFKRNLAGVETLITTTNDTTVTTANTLINNTIYANINTPVTLLNTDRIVVKFYMVITGGNTTVDIYFDANTQSRFTLPSVQLTKTYVDQQDALKQNQLNGIGFVKANGTTITYDNSTYLTGNQTISLTGQATGSGTTSIPITLDNNSVISKVLTGLSTTSGTVLATDSILTAISKLNGNNLASVTTNINSFKNLTTYQNGTTYIITDADVNLYGGTEIYLTSSNNGIINGSGIGKFYNPKYANYQIFKGSISHVIGNKCIWGGKVWINVTGALGTVNDSYTLSNAWTAIAYNSTDYNLVYNEIKFDIQNDLITYRNENNNNIVSFSNTFKSYFGLHPIKAFKWGNEYDSNTQTGIGSQNIIDSYNENVNFDGQYQRNVTMTNYSYQMNLNFYTDCYQDGIILNNYSYQTNLAFTNGSYQFNIHLNNNSFQNDLNFYNFAYQDTLYFNNTGYQEGLDFQLNAHQNKLIFNSGSQLNLYANDKNQTNFEIVNYQFDRLGFNLTTNEVFKKFEGSLTVQTDSTYDKILVKKNNEIKELALANLGVSTKDYVQEYANLAGFPVTGTSEIIYIAIDTNLLYRWDSNVYVLVGGSGSGSAITLTTNGSNGSSTLISNVLNVPTYTLNGLGGQPILNGNGFVKISGTTISYDNSTYLTTITGTSNRISITSNNIDISSLYVGQTSITTLGTITTGTWNGTSISDTYISSASVWNAKPTTTYVDTQDKKFQFKLSFNNGRVIEDYWIDGGTITSLSLSNGISVLEYSIDNEASYQSTYPVVISANTRIFWRCTFIASSFTGSANLKGSYTNTI